MSEPVLFLTLAGVLAALLTDVLRRLALRHALLDHPNARSSHTRPTPRGGGVAIVIAFLLTATALLRLEQFPPALWRACLAGGIPVALIGFLDDRGHIPARWRLAVHFTGAGLALLMLGNLPAVLPGETGRLVLLLLAALFLVWLLNLVNFMDGIDGIASTEAITVTVGGAACALLAGGAGPAVWPPLLLAASSAGFLLWNWPPARIFMGDAGSGFLGLTLGVLSLHAAQTAPVLFVCWLILLAVFITDATTTLLRRVLRGQRCYEAHRSHAYQHAARRLGRHRPVTLATAAINLFWLLPLALLVASRQLGTAAGLLLAYTPLLWLAWRLKAGMDEPQ